MFAVQVHATIESVAAVLQKKGYTQINGDRGARLWCSHSPQAGMLLLSSKSKRSCDVEIISAPWTTETLNATLGLLGGLSVTLTLSARSTPALAMVSDSPTVDATSASDVADPFAEFAAETVEEEIDAPSLPEGEAGGSTSPEILSHCSPDADNGNSVNLEPATSSDTGPWELDSSLRVEVQQHVRHDGPASIIGVTDVSSSQESISKFLPRLQPNTAPSLFAFATESDQASRAPKLVEGVA